MGKIFSSFYQRLKGRKEVRIVMIGLDNSGKTTILYRLRLGEHISTIPTIGFNVEQLTHKNISFSVWDVGGQDKIRVLWRHYFEDTQGVIFVIDSNDSERLDQNFDGARISARDELHRVLLNEDLRGAPLLVFANKQDLRGALSAEEVSERLLLDKVKDRDWHVQGSCAVTGEGLYEGLDWFSKVISGKR